MIFFEVNKLHKQLTIGIHIMKNSKVNEDIVNLNKEKRSESEAKS